MKKQQEDITGELKVKQCHLIKNILNIDSIKGIRPELKLKTADGATLLESDPVSLILSLADENLIQSEILDWKLPSLSKRYIEACSERKCG